MYEKILLALDGSKTAEMVIPYVEEIAAKLGSQIILVSVAESKTTVTDHFYRSYLEPITEQVQRQLKDWGAREEVKVQNKVLLGKPADEILRYADENNVGLIAMTSRGSSVRGPWLLGSVATQILRATGKPVLLIRAPATNVALRQKGLVKRILVPLDASKLGEAAIPWTEALASALGAELVLFQVVEPERTWTGEVYYATPQEEESRKISAISYLDGVGKPLKDRGLSVSCAAGLGSPADQIIDYAKANTIDLIAMCTHGRSGIGRWVFGSVTDKVLHAGDTAVLIARQAKAHTSISLADDTQAV